MSIEKYKGGLALGEASVAVLSSEPSAVVITNFVKRPRRIVGEFANGDRSLLDILRTEVDLSPLESLLGRWAMQNAFGDCVMNHGFMVFGGSSAHIDATPVRTPVVASLGLQRTATWRTQLPKGEVPTQLTDSFVDDEPIDEFKQSPGDLVLIPAYTIHEISAHDQRTAAVFISQAQTRAVAT